MYATVTANHFALREDFTADVHDQRGDYIVVCHVTNTLYLSFTRDEARRFADALIAAADKADNAQDRLDALSKPDSIIPPALVPVGHEDYPEAQE